MKIQKKLVFNNHLHYCKSQSYQKALRLKQIANIKGKKVAYVKATTAQYFLTKMSNMKLDLLGDIDAKESSTSDGLTALIGGNIDALASYGNHYSS